jgi:hypothetical protein
MTTAGDILTRVQEKLNDTGAVRWPDAENFRAISDAQSAILEARPDLFETHASMTPVEGVLQSVPADCFLLFDVVGNLDSGGDLSSIITPVRRSLLDRQSPGWVTLTKSAVTLHWMQDQRERAKFYVVPGQPASGRSNLLLRYAQRPTEVTSALDVLPLEDDSINAIYNFCMHRALEKDEKFAGSPTAASYMQKFAQFIGARTAGEDSANAGKAAEEGV